MSKFKKCEVLLVSESLSELNSWIEQYKKSFISVKNPVENTPIKKCCFDIDNTEVIDFRAKVTFVSKHSKNNIYFLSNNIKANPIKFS